MGCPDWHTSMHSIRLQRLVWIYCSGRAGLRGSEQADRLASTADITSGLRLGRVQVLRSLRNFLNMDRPEHHSVDRPKEKMKLPTFHPRKLATIYVQPDEHWRRFEGNLGKTAERRSGARMGLSERDNANLSRN